MCLHIGLGNEDAQYIMGGTVLNTTIMEKDLGLTISKKASSYIAQYPVLSTIQSTLHFTSLTDLFTQTPFWLLWEAPSHMLQLMRIHIHNCLCQVRIYTAE